MRLSKLSLAPVALLALGLISALPAAAQLTPKQELGKALYFDQNLSLNKNQACASCHLPPGWADPRNAADPANLVVSEGSILGLFGGRNAPSSAYAAFSPFFQWDAAAGLFVGGQFWDGRANTLKDQAKGPFLNPVEMAMPSKRAVLEAAADPFNPNLLAYQTLFMSVFRVDLASLDLNNTIVVDAVYDLLAEAIGDFEKNRELNAFTSKYDYYLAGKVRLSGNELRGLQLFNGKAKCALCHLCAPAIAADGVSVMPPLFTDFTYDNLGIPKSINPLLAANPVDFGLGGRADIAALDPQGLQLGKFKVMTLRNIALTAPYGHNGYFATLTDIVNFYNTAGIPGMWPPPEVPHNVNRAELGNLGLMPMQVAHLVAFLNTLSDGYRPGPSPLAFPLPPLP